MNHRSPFRGAAALGLIVAATLAIAWSVLAATGYKNTILTSNQTGVGVFTDTNLVNAWGIGEARGGPFWIANANSGVATNYLGTGQPQSPVVTIPKASGTGKSQPTGVASNSTTGFVITEGANSGPATFLFDSEDGAISGWNATVDATNAIIAVNNSASGADYKGLAVGVNGTTNVLYATNFHTGKVEMYDQNFHLVRQFTDTTVPVGFAPFGIANLKGTIFVTFAKQDAAKKNHVACAGCGYVSTFKQNGTFIKQLVATGNLNAPYGVAIAPATYKALSNDLLIGNVGDGKINAYVVTTGAFVSTMNDSTGAPIVISGLWGLLFGTGGVGGPPNALFYAAGTSGYRTGQFGSLTAN